MSSYARPVTQHHEENNAVLTGKTIGSPVTAMGSTLQGRRRQVEEQLIVTWSAWLSHVFIRHDACTQSSVGRCEQHQCEQECTTSREQGAGQGERVPVPSVTAGTGRPTTISSFLHLAECK
eukprot:1144606-Pelagomonas_calceolata.AAC.5